MIRLAGLRPTPPAGGRARPRTPAFSVTKVNIVPFSIIRHDITKLKVDAVVNAANTTLEKNGVFNAAGACEPLAPIKTGEAVITPGFNLPTKFIIHTAAPVYHDGNRGEEKLLRACYINSLKLATENQCESVAFPLISSGILGYPEEKALRVATTAICDYIYNNDIKVFLVMLDKSAFETSKIFGEVENFIDKHFVDKAVKKERFFQEKHRISSLFIKERKVSSKKFKAESPVYLQKHISKSVFVPSSLDNLVKNLDEPFSTTLLRLIDRTGKKDSEIYRRANIDRRLFSKIRSNAAYSPGKPTVLAFAIALELNLSQTEDLLRRAGFALSRSHKFDVIIEYFIQKQKYDIFQINQVLFAYDQPLLGG